MDDATELPRFLRATLEPPLDVADVLWVLRVLSCNSRCIGARRTRLRSALTFVARGRRAGSIDPHSSTMPMSALVSGQCHPSRSRDRTPSTSIPNTRGSPLALPGTTLRVPSISSSATFAPRASTMTIAKAKMSTAGVYVTGPLPLSRISSGAWCVHVPVLPVDRTRISLDGRSVRPPPPPGPTKRLSLPILASPKSPSLRRPRPSTKRFNALMSRWTTPRS
mmetsp:Transcript_21148/g.61510  ORF Transcript_21148/g.61510 Transcript_21148/m.61510 type:complete len:222 (+) Transcript_21148:1202-1867(+)